MKPDYHFAALMGELGCWMDHKVTKLTQVGTEHCLVPHLSQYFNLGESLLARLPMQLSFSIAGNGIPLTSNSRKSALCTEGSPFDQLREILAAALHPAAEGYKLSLSILLKGSRGIGKCTIARWAAQDLGLHVLEVSFMAP